VSTLTAPMATLALRPYQQGSLDAIEAAWLRGIRRPLIALPTRRRRRSMAYSSSIGFVSVPFRLVDGLGKYIGSTHN
jgi:hypothetical protein